MTTPKPSRVDGRLTALIAVILGLGALLPVLVAAIFSDRLPGQIARNWGPRGDVTGTWSVTTQLWTLGLVTVVVGGGIAAMAIVSRMPRSARQVMAGCAVWVATLFASLQIGSLLAHRDLAADAQAPSPGLWMVIGTLLGAAIAVPVARLVPADPQTGHAVTAPPPASAPRLSASAPLPQLWVSPRMVARALDWVTLGVAVGVVIAALINGWSWISLWVVLLGVAVCTALLAFARFRTTIDPAGVHVRAGGFRVLHIPLAEISSAQFIEDVQPLREFGGWGLRADVKGRTGVVTRRGEALQILRGETNEVVITIDEALHAARILNTYADRRRPHV